MMCIYTFTEVLDLCTSSTTVTCKKVQIKREVKKKNGRKRFVHKLCKTPKYTEIRIKPKLFPLHQLLNLPVPHFSQVCRILRCAQRRSFSSS